MRRESRGIWLKKQTVPMRTPVGDKFNQDPVLNLETYCLQGVKMSVTVAIIPGRLRNGKLKGFPQPQHMRNKVHLMQ